MQLKPGHTRNKISGDWRLLRCGCGGGWKDQLARHENKWRGITISTRKKKPYGCDLEKEEKLDRPYTQRWKPAKGGDRGSDDRKKPSGKKTIGYAKWVSERSVVCEVKEKGGKQERMENMEAKNLPNGRTLTTTKMVGPSTSTKLFRRENQIAPSGHCLSEDGKKVVEFHLKLMKQRSESFDKTMEQQRISVWRSAWSYGNICLNIW